MILRVLSDEQLAKLHAVSLDILAEVGVRVPHDEMLARLADAGARVDSAKQHVLFPPEMVERCIASAGKQFTIYGRDRSKTAQFGHGTRNYNSIAGEALWIDDDFTERRYPTLDDVTTAARLGDALPHINIVGAMADPQGIPPECRCVYVAAELLKNTTKPITFWFHDRASARFILDLFAVVAGSEADAIRHPFAYPFLEPISPLRFARHGIDLLFETCRYPLPVPIGPMAQVGATGPGALAGTLAQENAEILAGLCLVQTIRPGTPICYGGIPHAFDMRTMQLVFAGPEQALMAVAMTQMGKHYGLPVYINVGLTDSKIPDAQAGIEAGITLVCGALAGADIFGHLGISGVDLGTSLPMLVMQHEIIGYVERILRGIAFDDDALGFDTIRKVGPGGNYLAEEHTALHFQSELWFPQLLDRNFWEPWRELARKDMLSRCRAMKDDLLANHACEPLPGDVQRDVDRLLADARRILTSH
ncbi:MAG TPA: trimethylamine methyltransferase family protein [Candidatus Hydrogenedentes bacterium]|nr:trimethylamine methyltransferase family protein [Candidatus Hydrogenedentota bacterium]HPC18226.1 trimethylamine methyltransferase family protein [Candidatus Hydrogenedentota bacterium]HRT21877.1 trimethylamine methyltransferase family protein [Candidatus Hydrogenedentota bacterium]HRT66619.1 trimethylamine methyltransferase family protein [Candidatus Hydrogenedentota bacterium]